MNQDSSKEITGFVDKPKGTTFLQAVIYIVAGIVSIMVTGVICLCIYKNNFTLESVLATLLAFFAIFISIFFYFKAEETSSKFYDSSYNFMKDISVTLGKIEERFGEKFNSLNDKISHLDESNSRAKKEIENKQEDKQHIINELLDKAGLSQGERDEYKQKLEERDKEIEALRAVQKQNERNALISGNWVYETSLDPEVAKGVLDMVNKYKTALEK